MPKQSHFCFALFKVTYPIPSDATIKTLKITKKLKTTHETTYRQSEFTVKDVRYSTQTSDDE